MAAALLFSLATAYDARATHEPAMKAGAAGSDIDEIEGDGEVILQETMRVSSPEDLIIQVTAECAIITELLTNNADSSANAFGSVRLRVEIDDRPVPVASNDTTESGGDDIADDDSEIGEVTFCNRAYGRTVTDQEDPLDGVDQEDDYIHSRTANAFNWLALDTGFLYDDPSNGNNIIKVELIADYDVTEEDNSVADAFVGSRTMIIEPIRVSNHEQVEPYLNEGQ